MRSKQANRKGEFGFENRYEDGIVLSFDFSLLVCEIGFLGSTRVQGQTNAI